MDDSLTSDRAFIRIRAGQIHYRTVGRSHPGGPLPLYMAHAGPGSSLGLEPLARELGATRRVIAPDMLGNGDSDPPAPAATDMAFYADCAVQLLDALDIEKVDFYGSHTGAQLGLELAIRYPERVRRIVFDGLALFDAALKQDLLANYAPVVTPDEYGAHVTWAWNFVRDQTLHFPYYRRDPAHRLLNTTVPAAASLHAAVIEVLKSLTTVRLAYNAAFSHDVAARAPLLSIPTLVLSSENDPLTVYHEAVAALIPQACSIRTERARFAALISSFLDRESGSATGTTGLAPGPLSVPAPTAGA